MNKEQAKIAVVGATGAVGREMLVELWDAGIRRVSAFASARSQGMQLAFGEKQLTVEVFSLSACAGYDYVLLSAGGGFSRAHGEQLAARNGCVIDNSSAFRLRDDIPLVVPEVNGALLQQRHSIIANPNCSTIQLVVVLEVLARAFGLEQVQVATYQAVSGAGQKGIDELLAQQQQQRQDSQIFAQQICNNILLAIDKFVSGGHCFEEVKIVRETQKILALPNLPVLATTVRVPVLHGHSEAVAVQLTRAVSRKELLNCLQDRQSIVLQQEDEHALLPTPLTITGDRRVWVTRVRLPYGEESSLWVQFFVLADNLKKGAATNAVQILMFMLGR